MSEKYRILVDFGSFSGNIELNLPILTQKCPYMGIESTIYRANKTISVIVSIQGTLSGTLWVHDQATFETLKIFLKILKIYPTAPGKIGISTWDLFKSKEHPKLCYVPNFQVIWMKIFLEKLKIFFGKNTLPTAPRSLRNFNMGPV